MTGERIWEDQYEGVIKDLQLSIAALRLENDRLRTAIRAAREDIERRDELSAIDTLRTAIGGE